MKPSFFRAALLLGLVALSAPRTSPAADAAATPAPAATPSATPTPAPAPEAEKSTKADASRPTKTTAPNPAKVAAKKGGKHRVITLENAYDRALASDQSIRIAWYAIRSANLLPWSAVARLGPQVSASGGVNASRNHSSLGTSYLEPAGIRHSDTRSLGFLYTQPLFDASVLPAYRYGKLSAKAARLQHQFTVRQVLFGVAQAYYDVLKHQQLVEVNQETVKLADEQLSTAQNRLDAGVSARVDVLRARSTLEGARNTLIQSQGALEVARDTLSNILNLGGKTNFTLVEPPDEPDTDVPFETALVAATDRREDLAISRIAVEQQRELRGQVEAQYAPQVVAQFQSNWTRGVNGTQARNHQEVGSLSVQLPIFTGGQREIDLINSNYSIATAKLQREQTEKAVESEVKIAWITVQTGREALQALTAEVAAATQNYTDMQSQYQAGTATSLDVQTALRDLNNSRTLYTNQLYNYQIALRDLKRAEALFEKARVESLREGGRRALPETAK